MNESNAKSESGQVTEAELVPVASTTVEAIERAQISELVATAKRWPRDIDRALSNAIRLATASVEIAEGCHYALPRAGKYITGPSIRLAKILAQCWGNCRHSTMLIGNDGVFVKTRAVFYDCETNHLAGEEVSRSIQNSKGQRYNLDMIQTTIAAASSIALRKAILDVIPEELVETVGAAAKKVAFGTDKPLVERRQRLLNRFARVDIGVSKEEILRLLGKSAVELINDDDLEKMHGILTSLNEGMVKKEDIFTAAAPPSVPKQPQPPSSKEVEEAKSALSEAQRKIKKASQKAREETGEPEPAAKAGEMEIPF